MKIVVIGGSGLIGGKVVAKLRELGHEAVAASPRTGVDTLTGAGVREALTGANVVVDVSNSPSFEDAAVLKFFETSGRNLLPAEKDAGVKHHVALSVVGTDRLVESGYFRAKMAQENLITRSGIPYTIVRATQFFEFLGSIAQAGAAGDVLRLSPALLQPIAAEDVATALVDVVLSPPVNGVVDIAGPEAMGMDETVRRYFAEIKDPRRIVTDPNAGYFGTPLKERSLVPIGSARLGRTGLAEWIRQQPVSPSKG